MKKLVFAGIALFSMNAGMTQTVNTTVSPENQPKAVQKSGTITPAMRAERSATAMKNNLKLSDEQYTKLVAHKTEVYTKIDEVKKSNQGENAKEARKQALQPVRVFNKTGLKEILTPDQYAKWESMVQERHEKFKASANARKDGQKPDVEENLIKNELEF